MAARSPQHPEAGWFTTPTQVNHRRYEALRAFFVDGLTYQLAAEQTPLNRTSVAEILVEEGFGRLLRGPAPAESSSPATAGRDTRLPRAAVLDLGAWPQRLDTTRAGLLLVLPDLVTWTWLAWSERPATPPPASSPPHRGCLGCWRSSSPAPGGSPTSMPCSPTPPPGCLPDWQSCPRSRRSPELLLPAA